MGGVILNQNYPFEIVEINPTYLTETDVWTRIEQLKNQLLAILKDNE